MAKDVKARLPVISAHPGTADAAKTQTAIGNMDNGIVDATATERDGIKDQLFVIIIGGKKIQSERSGIRFDDGRHLIQGVETENRKNGAEYFLLHDWRFERDIIHHGRLNT